MQLRALSPGSSCRASLPLRWPPGHPCPWPTPHPPVVSRNASGTRGAPGAARERRTCGTITPCTASRSMHVSSPPAQHETVRLEGCRTQSAAATPSWFAGKNRASDETFWNSTKRRSSLLPAASCEASSGKVCAAGSVFAVSIPRPMGLQNTCERAERNTQARGQAEEASGSATRGRFAPSPSSGPCQRAPSERSTRP